MNVYFVLLYTVQYFVNCYYIVVCCQILTIIVFRVLLFS